MGDGPGLGEAGFCDGLELEVGEGEAACVGTGEGKRLGVALELGGGDGSAVMYDAGGGDSTDPTRLGVGLLCAACVDPQAHPKRTSATLIANARTINPPEP